MIGVELAVPYKEVRQRLLFEQHCFTGCAGTSTLRLLPPLCLTKAEADDFISRLKQVLNWNRWGQGRFIRGLALPKGCLSPSVTTVCWRKSLEEAVENRRGCNPRKRIIIIYKPCRGDTTNLPPRWGCVIIPNATGAYAPAYAVTSLRD